MTKETICSRYESIWNDYLSELAKNPNVVLSRYLRLRQVNVHNFDKWKSHRGYSVHDAKAHAYCLHAGSTESPDAVTSPDTSFVPVVIGDSPGSLPIC